MDAIAAPFSATRDRPWPQVERFLATLPEKARVIDVGGGNGRHARVAAAHGLHPVLVDVSGSLLRHARGLDRVQADMMALPFQTATADAALCIAAIHCIQGRKARIQALAELERILRPGARALASVWARDQPRLAARARTYAGPGAEVGDVIVPWGKDVDRPVERFFHLYGADELGQDARAAGFTVGPVDSVDLTGQGVPDNHFVELSKAPAAALHDTD